jgi:hypothetical protein
MASLVDGSKPTPPPLAGGRGVVPAPADASRAGNPALPIGQNDYRTTGNTGNSPWTAPRE